MATNCKPNKYIGKSVILELVIACGDTIPLESAWTRLGAMRTKDFTGTWDSADGTADDSVGSIRESLSTFLGFSVSGDGTLVASGASGAFLKELTKHFFNPVATGDQPNVWARVTYPDLTFTAYCRMADFSRSAPYDDVATYSIELEATASEFGVIVEDTPDPDAPAVDAVAVTPATASITEGATRQLTVSVTPAGAAQGVTWASSDTSKATVSQSGLVTAVAAGTASITATSNADSTKKGTCAVTVTA